MSQVDEITNTTQNLSLSCTDLSFASDPKSSPCCSSDLVYVHKSASQHKFNHMQNTNNNSNTADIDITNLTCTSTVTCQQMPTNDIQTSASTSTSVSSDTTKSATTETSTSTPSFPPLSLGELVNTVQTELQGRRDMNVVRAAMKAYNTDFNEWKRFEFWDKHKSYTRNLIATDYSTYTLMLLCWNPEKCSPIHDHAGSDCFMRMVEGHVTETQYHWAHTIDEHLKIKSQSTLQPGDVAYICDSIGLHKVSNFTKSPAVTLHLYMPPYESCQCFMDETGAATIAHVTFYSEQGELVEHTPPEDQ